MDANVLPDPANEDQDTSFPLSSELIGSIIQPDQPHQVLNSKQVRKIRHLANQIHTGDILIRIVNGRAICVAPFVLTSVKPISLEDE